MHLKDQSSVLKKNCGNNNRCDKCIYASINLIVIQLTFSNEQQKIKRR